MRLSIDRSQIGRNDLFRNQDQPGNAIVATSSRLHCLIFAAGLATLFHTFGCADRGVDLGEFGRVSGTVKFEGNPLKQGIIMFQCPDTGQVASAKIQPDGSYTMNLGKRKGLPLGDYVVTVRPPLARSQVHVRRPNAAHVPQNNVGSGPEIPDRYRFETRSGLAAKVRKGDNTCNFNLEGDR